MNRTRAIKEMEHELLLWWNLAQWVIEGVNNSRPELREYRDELEAIRLHSTWPQLRTRAAVLISKLDALHPEWRIDCVSSG